MVVELGGTDTPVLKRWHWTVDALELPPDVRVPQLLVYPLMQLFRLTSLKMTERYVLQVLLLHCHYDNLAEPVFPSMERIGEMIGGRSVRTVSKAIKNLETAGYIVRQVRRKVHGRYRGVTHTYFTPLMAELVQMPYHPDRVKNPDLFHAAFDAEKFSDR